MHHKISRRAALAAGTTATGMMFCSNQSVTHARTLPDVWGEDFLPQWSPGDHVKRNLTAGKTPIRLCCTSYGLSNAEGRNVTEQVKSIRDAGYTAAEAPFAGWRKMSDSDIRELQAALKQHDLLFYNIHVWTNIIHPDSEQCRKNQLEIVRAIEMAEQVGIKFILTHTGSRSYGKPSIAHKLNWTKETWDMSVNALKRIISDTAGSNVALALEAVNTTNLNSPAAHVRLKQDVGSDRIKVTLDPTNMLYAGNVFRTTELINNCFELIGEDIMYAHAKDVKWTEMLPGLNWVIPGQGEMDYETYLTHLSRLKYTRPLMLEFLKRDQYPEAKQFVEETAAKVGVKIYR